MLIRVGCEFDYVAPGPTPTVWQVRPRAERAQSLVYEAWGAVPAVPWTSYHDPFGNVCDRLTLPPGRTVLRYDANVQVHGKKDDADTTARQVPVESLPDEAMVFLLPSRFCLSDALRDQAWELFGATAPGWAWAAAVCDWVHDNVQFQMGSSNPLTSVLDVWQARTGVCRDFAHLGLTLCRSLNIPARYVFGYIPDVDVPVALRAHGLLRLVRGLSGRPLVDIRPPQQRPPDRSGGHRPWSRRPGRGHGDHVRRPRAAGYDGVGRPVRRLAG